MAPMRSARSLPFFIIRQTVVVAFAPISSITWRTVISSLAASKLLAIAIMPSWYRQGCANQLSGLPDPYDSPSRAGFLQWPAGEERVEVSGRVAVEARGVEPPSTVRYVCSVVVVCPALTKKVCAMSKMTVRELTERYALLRELKPKTLLLYGMLWDRFERFLGREATVADLDDLVVARYLKWRAEATAWRGRPPSPASVRKDRVMIQAVWNYAARKRIVSEFPELPRIKVPARLPVGMAYTADDVSQLIRTAKRRIGKVGGLPSKWWWPTLIYAAVCSGERFTALTSLRWAQVDLERCRLVFLASTRKNATRDIERAITPQLSRMMAEHRRDAPDLVWPWDRRTRSQWASLKVLCRTAGVQYRGFHGFRRTAASYAALRDGTAAATALLDHSDPRLQRVYVDPLICPTGTDTSATLPPLDLDDSADAIGA